MIRIETINHWSGLVSQPPFDQLKRAGTSQETVLLRRHSWFRASMAHMAPTFHRQPGSWRRKGTNMPSLGDLVDGGWFQAKVVQFEHRRAGSWRFLVFGSFSMGFHSFSSPTSSWLHQAALGGSTSPPAARSMKGKMEPEQRQALIEEGKKIKEDWDVASNKGDWLFRIGHWKVAILRTNILKVLNLAA